MPPSGYTKPQSNAIVQFLSSVTNSLIEEGTLFKLTAAEALKREIDNIQQICQSEQFGIMSDAVLKLTALYYERLLAQKPKGYEQLRQFSVEILADFDEEILAIHVPSISVPQS